MKKNSPINKLTGIVLASMMYSATSNSYSVHADQSIQKYRHYLSNESINKDLANLKRTKFGVVIYQESAPFMVNGVLANGWVHHVPPKDGYNYLYYKDGIRLTGIGSDGLGEHYFINGSLAQGEQEFNGTTRMYKDGNPVNGVYEGGYYYDGYGANGWIHHVPPVSGCNYLFYKDGKRLTGIGSDGLGEHYFTNGLLAQGEYEVDGRKRVFKDGNPLNGTYHQGYYIDGYGANGWVHHVPALNGYNYIFYRDGKPLTGKGVDGLGVEHLYVNGQLAQGAQYIDGVTIVYKDGDPVNGIYQQGYYINGVGHDGWMHHVPPVDGYNYLFYKEGKRLTGLGVDSEGPHYFVNGVLAQGEYTFEGEKRMFYNGAPLDGWMHHVPPKNGYNYIFYQDGTPLTGRGTDVNGEHLFVNGQLAQGEHIEDGIRRMYQNGDLVNGVFQGGYYFDGVGANGWVHHIPPVNGYNYIFYKNGKPLTGMGTDNDGEHYFVNGQYSQTSQSLVYFGGTLANGWIKHVPPVDGYNYLFYKDGKRLTGMGTDGLGEHYFVNGALAQGEYEIMGGVRLYKDGNPVNGVYGDGYYFDGYGADGWIRHVPPVDGYNYLFYVNGKRLTGTGTDALGEHYFVNGALAQGECEVNGEIRMYKDGNLVNGVYENGYYYNGYGANGWIKHVPPVDGYNYLFYVNGKRHNGIGYDSEGEHYFSNGALAQGVQVINGESYVYKDGNLANGWLFNVYYLNGKPVTGFVETESGEQVYVVNGRIAQRPGLSENYTNEEFIDEIAYYVRKYAPNYGIKVYSGIIAQAILESNWGRSLLSAKYHNYFGLKAGPYWTGKSVNMATKEEYTPGITTDIRDNFRVFDSLEEGVIGYFEFTKFPNYAAIKTATTPEEYVTYIKNAGYATSSTYIQNVLNVVYQYNLTRYDY